MNGFEFCPGDDKLSSASSFLARRLFCRTATGAAASAFQLINRNWLLLLSKFRPLPSLSERKKCVKTDCLVCAPLAAVLRAPTAAKVARNRRPPPRTLNQMRRVCASQRRRRRVCVCFCWRAAQPTRRPNGPPPASTDYQHNTQQEQFRAENLF